jgi:hypothetical protein
VGLIFSRAHWTKYLSDRGVPFVDCHVTLTPALIVPGDRHPNAHAHARWADCLEPVVAPWAQAVLRD